MVRDALTGSGDHFSQLTSLCHLTCRSDAKGSKPNEDKDKDKDKDKDEDKTPSTSKTKATDKVKLRLQKKSNAPQKKRAKFKTISEIKIFSWSVSCLSLNYASLAGAPDCCSGLRSQDPAKADEQGNFRTMTGGTRRSTADQTRTCSQR